MFSSSWSVFGHWARTEECTYWEISFLTHRFCFGYATFSCKPQHTWLKVAENFVTLHKDSSRVSMFTEWAQQVRGQDGKQLLGLCPPTILLGLFSVIYHKARGSSFFFAFFVFNFLIFLSGWETLHILPTVFSSFPIAPLERIWSPRSPAEFCFFGSLGLHSGRTIA